MTTAEHAVYDGLCRGVAVAGYFVGLHTQPEKCLRTKQPLGLLCATLDVTDQDGDVIASSGQQNTLADAAKGLATAMRNSTDPVLRAAAHGVGF